MDVLLHAERVLPCPVDAAFALAVDPVRFPALFAGFGPIPALRRIELHAPLAPGATRSVHSSDGSQLTERVIVHQPPQRHAYVLDGLRPPLRWQVRQGEADWRFTAVQGGTFVAWRYRFTLAHALVWPLAAPLLAVFMRGAMRRCLAAMADACATPSPLPVRG
jgi:hypothetical protein